MNKPLISFSLLLVLGAVTTYFFSSMKQQADLLLVDARVYTVDKDNSLAGAVAVRGNRIVAVGTTEDIQKRYTSSTVIDAKGKPVYPGFIDAHAHVGGLGVSLDELDLSGTRSVDEIARMLAAKASVSNPGRWIRGRGWDQNDWNGDQKKRPFPTAAMLDKAAPKNPVVLTRIDGHALWVNTRALELCGLSGNAPRTEQDVEGGRVIRDTHGKPTGVFVDNAMVLIREFVPPYTKEEWERMYSTALGECVKIGLTGVHDMGIDKEDYEIYRAMLAAGRLPIRIYAAISGTDPLWKEFLAGGPYVDGITRMLTVRAVKMYIDGALGSRGAALLEPYSDEPDNRGLTVMSAEAIASVADAALEHGFQICTHAIGDRGNNIVLNAYERALALHPEKLRNSRFRIEHAQVLGKEDIPRFEKLGIIASMQPTHCTSDMYWAQARLGPERVRTAYAWHSLLESGALIASGSDFPVESPNPLLGFYAAITRQDPAGIPRTARDVAAGFLLSADGIRDSADFLGGWYPDQKMTREEALRSFTIWAAYAEFAEREKGSIEQGKLADFVILSRDIMTIAPTEILLTNVVATIVGGKVKYRRDEAIP